MRSLILSTVVIAVIVAVPAYAWDWGTDTATEDTSVTASIGGFIFIATNGTADFGTISMAAGTATNANQAATITAGAAPEGLTTTDLGTVGYRFEKNNALTVLTLASNTYAVQVQGSDPASDTNLTLDHLAIQHDAGSPQAITTTATALADAGTLGSFGIGYERFDLHLAVPGAWESGYSVIDGSGDFDDDVDLSDPGSAIGLDDGTYTTSLTMTVDLD